MHFDQDGTYNLVYIAEDECGNKTLAERVVEVATYRTVLYPDGTLIINEKGIDQASNEALHGGTATNVYIPFDPNGATDVAKYIFANTTKRPWNDQRQNIKSVKVGSVISPTDLSVWFNSIAAIDIDLTNLDTSNVTSMDNMFSNCFSLTSLNLGDKFDTSNVTSMLLMFGSCQVLTSLDLGDKFDTSNVTNMEQMFTGCYVLSSLDLGDKFDTSNVTSMDQMFANCRALPLLDLGNEFDTSNVTNMTGMFINDLSLVTILTPATFVVSQVTSSTNMFNACSRLVGGAGTTYNRNNPKDKTYAHIDGGTSNPGYFTAKA